MLSERFLGGWQKKEWGKRYSMIAISKNNKQGYLLIEALCALALLSMLTLFAAHGHITALFLQQDGLRRLAALSVAQNYIEQWLATQDNPQVQVMGEDYRKNKSAQKKNIKKEVSGMSISKDNRIMLESYLVPHTLSHALPTFNLIKVKVTWQPCHGKAETIELYAGCAHV